MFQTKITNPVLPGFNPDPNILKVGDTYYLAVSSFEWLPGVRVYTSKDLVNWVHTTDILTTQVDLRGNPANCSIWAPQISFADGLFYCVYTDVKATARPFKDCHNFIMTAEKIEGPWSTPVYVNSSGFDPSLFHDEDGRKWFLNELWDYRMTTGNKSCGIVLQEYDAQKQALIGPVYKIFDGTKLAKTEAPLLYKRNGYYYLLTAEGGTGSGHSVTVCRAKNVTGPYELDPHYPILTASNLPDSPIQCSGHASLVEGAGGHFYLAFLGTRPLLGRAAILGRETMIQEVRFAEDGWLRLVNGTTAPEQNTIVYTENEVTQRITTDFLDDFNGPLANEWNFLRDIRDLSWADLTTVPGSLRLHAGESMQSAFEHHLLAIRQKDFRFTATTNVTSTPTTFNQMAGLMLFLNTTNYLYMYVTYDEKMGKVLRLMKSVDGEFSLSPEKIALSEASVCLKIQVEGSVGKFLYRRNAMEEWRQIDEPQDLLFLAGGFTGNFVGIAAHDMDKKCGSYADFDFFEYQGKDRD